MQVLYKNVDSNIPFPRACPIMWEYQTDASVCTITPGPTIYTGRCPTDQDLQVNSYYVKEKKKKTNQTIGIQWRFLKIPCVHLMLKTRLYKFSFLLCLRNLVKDGTQPQCSLCSGFLHFTLSPANQRFKCHSALQHPDLESLVSSNMVLPFQLVYGQLG